MSRTRSVEWYPTSSTLNYSVSIDAPAFGVFTIRLLCIRRINQVGGSGGTWNPTQKGLRVGDQYQSHNTKFSPTSLTYRYLLADLGPDVPPYVSPWSCWDMGHGGWNRFL